jgi:CheY-like chemotaxis protein
LGPAVLIVENEEVVRDDVAGYLEDLGLIVFQAESTSAAVTSIMRHPEIALVFLNIRMPGPMDGHDLAQWLALNHPRIIVMVAKPYKPTEVSATILKVLEHTAH